MKYFLPILLLFSSLADAQLSKDWTFQKSDASARRFLGSNVVGVLLNKQRLSAPIQVAVHNPDLAIMPGANSSLLQWREFGKNYFLVGLDYSIIEEIRINSPYPGYKLKAMRSLNSASVINVIYLIKIENKVLIFNYEDLHQQFRANADLGYLQLLSEITHGQHTDLLEQALSSSVVNN